MTQHPSLKIKGAGSEHRSVLKRFERLMKLQKEEKWEEGDNIFGLPKVKTLRLKMKKEKVVLTPEEEAAAAAAAEGAEGAPEGTEGTQAKAVAPDKSKEAKPGKEGKPGKESNKKPAEKK